MGTLVLHRPVDLFTFSKGSRLHLAREIVWLEVRVTVKVVTVWTPGWVKVESPLKYYHYGLSKRCDPSVREGTD